MNIDMIRAAARRLSGHARVTPLLSSPFLDEIAGRRVYVKAECLQWTGSFKYRGGRSAVSALMANGGVKGVIAYSSGNHAQGVAKAAQEFGLPAVIVMPEDAPKVKIANTRAYGAEVITYERAGRATREEIGQQLMEERGLTLIKPYDEPEVIAGQGTCGLELAAQAAEAGVSEADVLVCCGGGGLTSGIALSLAEDAPGLRVRPVEPEGFDDVRRSLASGGIEHNNVTSGNLLDAILTPSPGMMTFPIMKAHCGPGLAVTEDEALRAMGQAFERLRIVVEPGGAASLAAALFQPDAVEGDAVIVVATGGNVDADIYTRALSTLS